MNTKAFTTAISDIIKKEEDSVYRIQHHGKELYIYYSDIAIYRTINHLGLIINNTDVIRACNLDIILKHNDGAEMKSTGFTVNHLTEFETCKHEKHYFKTQLLKLLDSKLDSYYFEYSQEKNAIYIYSDNEKNIFIAAICEVRLNK